MRRRRCSSSHHPHHPHLPHQPPLPSCSSPSQPPSRPCRHPPWASCPCPLLLVGWLGSKGPAQQIWSWVWVVGCCQGPLFPSSPLGLLLALPPAYTAQISQWPLLLVGQHLSGGEGSLAVFLSSHLHPPPLPSPPQGGATCSPPLPPLLPLPLPLQLQAGRRIPC